MNLRYESGTRNLRKNGLVLCFCLLGASLSLPMSARAQTFTSTDLPMSLAVEAATEAARVCSEKGFKVAVAVVDVDGVIKVQLRGDGSPIHSQGFSFRKAYTMVSLGPMFGVDSGSSIVKQLPALTTGFAAIASGGSSNLLFLPGSILIKSGDQAIGAIGISGAPKSVDDEICAEAGVDKIKNRLIGRAHN